MSSSIRKAVQLTLLLQRNRRITVRRIQQEIGLSRSATYRWLQIISPDISIRLDDGVVYIEPKEKIDQN